VGVINVGVAGTLSCKHCSYSQNVSLGFGFSFMHLNSILQWYEQEEGRQRIREFMSKPDTTFECFYGLYVCEECKNLLNRIFLELKSGDDVYTNRHDCPRCGTQMPTKPPIDDVESTELDCPACGEAKLEVQLYMDWD
jgi:ribosomal protein S27AE